MITDKKFLIIAGCVILVMLLLVGLTLCKKTDDDFSSLDLLDGDGEGGDENVVGYYRIVLSGSCSAEVADAARTLEKAIEEATGIDCGVTYDTSDTPIRTDAVEILVGNTNRNSSAIALEGLRMNDYICKWISGSLVIGGLSNSATLSALERFTEEVLPYATASELMAADLSFTYHHDYAVDSIKLCGFEISDYSIVCDEEALELARVLADKTADACGYYLGIRQGIPRDGVKEIAFVTDDTINGAAYISYNGEDVVVSAKDTYGASVAFEKLYGELFSSATESVDVVISSQITCPYTNPEISVTSILTELDATEDNVLVINDSLAYIKENTPDVVVFSNITQSALETIMLVMPSHYNVALRSGTSEKNTAVIYSSYTVGVTYDMAKNDELSIIKMRVTHNASGEIYESIVVAGSASTAVELSGIIVNNISDASNAVVTLILNSAQDYTADLSSKGLLAKYNTAVHLNNSDYRAAIMHGELITSTSVQLTYNASKSVAFTYVTFGKMYCGDYLKNIQQ